MGLLILVRHGQASADQADYDVLSPLGRRQAGLVATGWPGAGWTGGQRGH